MQTTSRGLTVWDLEADNFSHTQMGTNWNLINDYWVGFDATTKLPKKLHTSATVPVTGAANEFVMLTADAGGYRANTLLRSDGSAWRPVNHMEIQPAVPTLGNFAGRVVILSAASGAFAAWDIIRWDGTAWALVGGWATINNGAGATNIVGVQTAKDVFVNDSARGYVMKDRGTGTNYRLFFLNGNLAYEAVT
jgi:hypothetical protein